MDLFLILAVLALLFMALVAGIALARLIVEGIRIWLLVRRVGRGAPLMCDLAPIANIIPPSIMIVGLWVAVCIFLWREPR